MSDPVKNIRTRNPVATREAILKAATTHFTSNNYNAVGLRQIAEDAGVDVALLSRYFGSKEEMFLTVLTNVMANPYILDLDKSDASRIIVSAALGDRPQPPERSNFLQMITMAAAVPHLVSPLRDNTRELVAVPLSKWLGGKNSLGRAKLLMIVAGGLALHEKVNGLQSGLSDEAFEETKRDLEYMLDSIILPR